GDFAPENLQRPEDIPEYWHEVVRHLDETDDGTRVLEIPGIDFASYRWGNTVDPITPGLTDRPYVARELIPYGSPASADLLNALDLGLQEQTLGDDALAIVARVMNVGHLVTRNDLQYERYNTPRPRSLWDRVTSEAGLGAPTIFGEGVPNVPVDEAPLLDEEHLVQDGPLPEAPAVGVFAVDDSVPIVHTHSTDATVYLSGNGAGIVDAAEAGLIHGDELIRYSADVTADADFVRSGLVDERALIVSDTNRKRAERWTTVRHTQGYTEQTDGGLLVDDVSDNRLPVFADRPGIRSVAEHVGLSARATGYGNPITYLPEDRPVNAVDGDEDTAWRVAAFADPRGERIEFDSEVAIDADHVRFLQPTSGEINRWITEIEVRFDGVDPVRISLDESSRRAPGQTVAIDQPSFESMSIEILDDTAGVRPGYGGLTSVGFAEVDLGVESTREYIRMPQDLLDAGGFRTLRYPLALVQTRERVVSTDETRSDPERSLARVVDLPTARDYRLAGTARLSAEAAPAVLDQITGRGPSDVGPEVTASSTLPGGLEHLASNVLDSDPSTVWTSAFGAPTAEALTVRLPSPTVVSELSLVAVDDDEHSAPREIVVEADGVEVARTTVTDADDGASRVIFDGPVTVSELRVTFPTVVERTTLDWYTGAPRALPLAVATLSVDGVAVPDRSPLIDSGCRNDLVYVDGVGVPVRITGDTAAALQGAELQLATCDERTVTLAGGDRRFDSAEGRVTGFDIDQLVWCSAAGGTACDQEGPLLDTSDGSGPAVEVLAESDATVRVAISGARVDEPFWLVLGQSFNAGWEILEDGVVSDPTVLVDGYANGFLVTPTSEDFEVTMRFVPQNRVEIGLLLSVVGALATLGIAVGSTRPGGPVPIPLQEPLRRIRALSWEGALPTRRDAVMVGVGAGLVGLLVANPLIGLLIGVLSGFATRREGWRVAFTVLPAALLAVAGLYVVATQFRNEVGPGLHWPMDTGRLHTLGLAAVVLLAIDVVIDAVWARRSEFR
ncbi:MAG: alpha-(1-_3)-arabinofuranosyltransferase family protein, partial [Acidimicrobiales bacterium]|nr:alpha-(1->3)-arabinofuranosyltransferase family protein [Acidimicrobiales bacterium]